MSSCKGGLSEFLYRASPQLLDKQTMGFLLVAVLEYLIVDTLLFFWNRLCVTLR